MTHRLVYVANVLALAAAYYASGRFGLMIAGGAGHATPVWPPTGLALAWLVLGGLRLWPGVVIGAFLVNYFVHAPTLGALGASLGNCAEAVVGAFLLLRSDFRPTLERLWDVATLVLFAALFSTTISATIGATSMALAHDIGWDQFTSVWITWWLGDTTGALLVAPLVLVWASHRGPILRRGAWDAFEAALVMAGLILAALFVFGEAGINHRPHYPIVYGLFLPLIWMALRFDGRGAVTAVATLSAIAVYMIAEGVGPFGGREEESFLLTAGFAATAALVSLVISATIAERRAVSEALGAANQAKDRFLAALSHELRTPLTPILSGIGLLQSDFTPGDADSREVLDVMRRNVELEARLIDDLLDVTRISRGKLQYHPTRMDVHVLIAVLVKSLAGDAQAKRQRLTIEIAAKNFFVNADPVRLQQVFSNLIRNAIKFTPEAGVITIKTRDVHGDGVNRGDAVAIDVIDTGIGIEPDVLPRLFVAFEQGDPSIPRRFGGLGLGLSIAHALVKDQGGKLMVHSAGKNQGATFTVELPALLPDAAATTTSPQSVPAERPSPSPASSSTSASASKPKILVVDDHLDTLRSIRHLLNHFGYDVLTADSLAAAKEIASGQQLDLLISDIGLGDGSGLDVLREIRLLQPVPAIAMSGYGADDDVLRSKEAGFTLHLIKPVDAKTLESAIESVLDRG